MARFFVYYRLPTVFSGEWVYLDMSVTAKDEQEAVTTIARRLPFDAEIYDVKEIK